MLVETGGKERSASEYKLLLEKHGFVDVQAKKVYISLKMPFYANGCKIHQMKFLSVLL